MRSVGIACTRANCPFVMLFAYIAGAADENSHLTYAQILGRTNSVNLKGKCLKYRLLCVWMCSRVQGIRRLHRHGVQYLIFCFKLNYLIILDMINSQSA